MNRISVDDLRAGAQRIETLARNCQKVVGHLSEMHDLLEKLDLAPNMSADDGRVVLSFDWGLPEPATVQVIKVPRPVPNPAPKFVKMRRDPETGNLTPEPEPAATVAWASEAQPGPTIVMDPQPAELVTFMSNEEPETPEPEPVEEPKSEPPNLIKSGPLSDEERDLIVDLASQGVPNAVIAERLNRKTQGICGAIAGPLRQRIAERTVKVQEAKAPVKAPPPDMQGEDARLFSYLEQVGYRDDWTAERDYQLVLILLRGEGIGGAKDTLGAEAADCRARWAELNRQPGDLDHQRRLVTVLRKRIELAAAEPA